MSHHDKLKFRARIHQDREYRRMLHIGCIDPNYNFSMNITEFYMSGMDTELALIEWFACRIADLIEEVHMNAVKATKKKIGGKLADFFNAVSGENMGYFKKAGE